MGPPAVPSSTNRTWRRTHVELVALPSMIVHSDESFSDDLLGTLLQRAVLFGLHDGRRRSPYPRRRAGGAFAFSHSGVRVSSDGQYFVPPRCRRTLENYGAQRSSARREVQHVRSASGAGRGTKNTFVTTICQNHALGEFKACPPLDFIVQSADPASKHLGKACSMAFTAASAATAMTDRTCTSTERRWNVAR
jgi:hypothetical protein